ncbi:MAG: pilus assembly protein PilM [Candidatus Omnitrophica bacterium]|nr:pilus assembly protein PilM [Candidatus Omnitrophota bacterium]MBU4478945.1 pilus assembly protein PilM [Candidatus Omnitrophota bacterium]MCG2703999.1 pilus assembly protein PilM [Candidatus Omnitrophota bacterium]
MDLKMPFFKTTVGLYIGPKTIQLAQLQAVAGRIHLTNFVHVDIFEEDQSAFENKEELVIVALRKAINKAKIDLKRVNTVLMPGMVLLRYFQMPRISPEEMEEAVRFEARKYIPFRLEEAVSGFYILKDDQESKKVGILSLVTKEESIKNHLTLLHKVNISPTAVETASFALLRLLEHAGEIDKNASNVVLYLYAQRLNIIILKNGIPYFVRDISLAKKEEWIDDETAEFLMGGRISAADNRMITLENMISELRISLEYYRKELGKEDISKMILCGEIDDFDDFSAVVEAAKDQPDNPCPLAVYLQKNFDIPVVIIDPLKSIVVPKAKPLPYTFPMLAVTIGAGLRNLSKSTVEIDLFRARKKPSIKTKVFISKMAIWILVSLLVSFISLFFVFSILESRERNLLEKEKRNRMKFMDLSHFSDAQLVSGEKEVEKRLDVFDKLVKKRILVTDKLSVLPHVIPEGVWLSSVTFSYRILRDSNQFERDVEMAIAGDIYSEQKGLEIEMVNDFQEKLKTNEQFFQGFKVIKTGSVTRGDFFAKPVMAFELKCTSKTAEQ